MMIEKAIENYKHALEAHIEAQRMETVSKDKVRKARHAVILAREEVRAIEREIMEDDLRNL